MEDSPPRKKKGKVQINNFFPFLEEAKQQQQQLQIIIPAEKWSGMTEREISISRMDRFQETEKREKERERARRQAAASRGHKLKLSGWR